MRRQIVMAGVARRAVLVTGRRRALNCEEVAFCDQLGVAVSIILGSRMGQRRDAVEAAQLFGAVYTAAHIAHSSAWLAAIKLCSSKDVCGEIEPDYGTQREK